MSDAEYEAFEVNDYDLDNEFNPNRSRRRPTKQQQIYGELDGLIIVEFTILNFHVVVVKKCVDNDFGEKMCGRVSCGV